MNYEGLLEGITLAHTETLNGVARVVDRALMTRNWLIGAYLVEFEQAGSDRAAYGEGLLKRVAKDLAASSIPGCGIRMLERMRAFYLAYPQLAEIISSPAVTISAKAMSIRHVQNSSPVVTNSTESGKRLPTALPPERVLNLSWTHVIELLGLDDPWKRAFYENECIKGGWSKRQLQRQIASLLYERTGLSTDKQAVIERARQQPPISPGSSGIPMCWSSWGCRNGRTIWRSIWKGHCSITSNSSSLNWARASASRRANGG